MMEMTLYDKAALGPDTQDKKMFWMIDLFFALFVVEYWLKYYYSES